MNLFSLLRASRKRKSIKLYLTRLGPILARRYGKKEYYTQEQVEAAAREAELPREDLCYGLSIYCTQADFDAFHAGSGEECSYWEMRVEVGEQHFHGNGAFTPHDVAEAVASHSTGSGGHSSGHGGGHDFGGGGHTGGHF